MPDYIHVVLILESEAAGASPRPTITDIAYLIIGHIMMQYIYCVFSVR